MKLLYQFERLSNKLKRIYRNRIFKERTGQSASLIGDITLINTNIKCGKDVCLYPGVMIIGDGPVVIGNNVDIGKDTIIYSSSKGGGVYIGNNTLIAAQCYIIDTDHGTKAGKLIREQDNWSSPITIGDDVWIAAGAKILKGSVLEDGCIIGAQSVVKGHIPTDAVAVGVPAKVIKYRK